MEVICINDYFGQEVLNFYAKFGVKTPKENKNYFIRDVLKTVNGKTAILLEEILNPKVPINHHILGQVEVEPNWDIARFVKLNGEEISKEEINEISKELVKQ